MAHQKALYFQQCIINIIFIIGLTLNIIACFR